MTQPAEDGYSIVLVKISKALTPVQQTIVGVLYHHVQPYANDAN